MAREIEIKLALDAPAGLRARLAAQGAACEGRVFEINTIFDTSDGRLRAAGMALRLREVRSVDRAESLRAVLTLKRPAQPQAGETAPRGVASEVKTRDEAETALADPAAGATILTSLGFRPVIVYEKRRETWLHANCEIVIDELPRLGWFVEIEGPSESAVRDAAAQLGVDADRAVHETYVALAASAGESVEGRRELRFPVSLPACP